MGELVRLGGSFKRLMEGGGGNGELFNGYRVLVSRDEKSAGDWLPNSVNVLHSELYI